MTERERGGLLENVIRFTLDRKLVVFLVLALTVGSGIMVAPFDWAWLPTTRSPVPTDAIPDIGENQQIVFTEWMGRSPQDVEDQVTYPLTVSLLGIPGVKTVRSYSYFGFSSIYVIFEEDIEFYWSRSRLLEKLASLPEGSLPPDVHPTLGPDATALGQVFWYTLEGRDSQGRPTGGWSLEELRTLQDWYVRYALMSAEGVSEVASVGGFVREYQVDVDPDAMRAHGVHLEQVFMAIRRSNVDVGARTIEVNQVEYVIRGLGLLETLEDIEDTVVTVRENVPIHVRDVATVKLGPAQRRGALDKGGVEAVGGVVVARYGSNPLQVIENTKKKIEEIAPGLASKMVIHSPQTDRESLITFANRQGFEAYVGEELNQEAWVSWLKSNPRETWPSGVELSQVTLIPFYDRAGLIRETLATLDDALTEEILVTALVMVVLLMRLRSSLLIGGLLPIAVLMCFIGMRLFSIQANIVALSGIAIAIGTMVDMGIIMVENILAHLERRRPDEDTKEVIVRASREVGSAILTAVATTVVSFLPVFTMTAAEGKLFRPLAYTKTFALIASLIVALTLIPPIAHLLFRSKTRSRTWVWGLAWAVASVPVFMRGYSVAGIALLAMSAYSLSSNVLSGTLRTIFRIALNIAAALFLLATLAGHWLPLGPGEGLLKNALLAAGLVGGLLVFFGLFQRVYPTWLRHTLNHKGLFLLIPLSLVALGLSIWLGFRSTFGFVPQAVDRLGLDGDAVTDSAFWVRAESLFPGLGREFMPSLDEGSYLYMPTTAPHASIGEALDILQYQDRAIQAIPEVESVVGKIGRAESPLDPAPVSMVETVINYKSEYIVDDDGHRLTFRYDDANDTFVRDDAGELIQDPDGRPYRQWRDSIRSTDDIWNAIVEAAEIPGATSAPNLQPIAARIVMLQSGMRAPMGIKVKGKDLETIEAVGIQLERSLKEVPGVSDSSVLADRLIGKPYLEIDLNRPALARHGLRIRDVQDVIEIAVGGKTVTETIEGRERFSVRLRYLRELRDDIESLEATLVSTPSGAQIPLTQLAEIRYLRGPQAIKSEDTFLVGYVVFDKTKDAAEVDVVEDCQRLLAEKIESGELILPAGVSYSFAGNYENQVRAQKTLQIVLPVALILIFLILYLQFSSISVSLIVFSGVLVAWSGGFLMVWAYGRPEFLDITLGGIHLRELFQIHPINLSVAIWVGFLALFGIATDDGVVISTYLRQSFQGAQPKSRAEVRDLVVQAARRRIRPALMTSATTILALLPVLTSSGRGSDIMIPMAIPTFGGMVVVTLSVFVVPVLYGMKEEWRWRRAFRSTGE